MRFRLLLPLLGCFLLLTGSASAQDFSIKNSCGENEESFFSLADEQGGNIGQPGYFQKELCASGVEEVKIQDDCSTDLTRMLSMYQENDSHASIYDSFRIDVCTSFSAAINNSCPAQDRIVSLGKKDDAHVGAPGELQYQLCAQERQVQTVTLEMSFDAGQVYVDGETAQEKTYSESELEYPYIVSDDPAGIVSYNDFLSLSYSTSGTTDIMRVTQDGKGSFLLPNTEGGYGELEDEQEEVNNREFLNKLNPNFAYAPTDEPLVKVIYDPAVDLHGFNRELRNSFELYARHRVDNDPGADIEIGPT